MGHSKSSIKACYFLAIAQTSIENCTLMSHDVSNKKSITKVSISSSIFIAWLVATFSGYGHRSQCSAAFFPPAHSCHTDKKLTKEKLDTTPRLTGTRGTNIRAANSRSCQLVVGPSRRYQYPIGLSLGTDPSAMNCMSVCVSFCFMRP